jgi:hypothetical protein
MPDPITNSSPPPCVVETEHGPVTCYTPPGAPKSSEIDVPLSELATRCLPELDAIVLGLASRHPIVGFLAGVKAGFEIAECIDQVQREEFLREVSATCREDGGVPVGLRDGAFICRVPETQR